MLHGNTILHGSLREDSPPSFLWVITLIFPSQPVLPRRWGRMGERTIFCKSFWLHVKCRMEMSLSVFNFFFFLYWLWCSTGDPYWKQILKPGNANFVRRFTCNQLDLKLSNFLFHYCHLMMAVPFKILFLLRCFASKKVLSGSTHVWNISLNSSLHGPH